MVFSKRYLPVFKTSQDSRLGKMLLGNHKIVKLSTIEREDVSVKWCLKNGKDHTRATFGENIRRVTNTITFLCCTSNMDIFPWPFFC